MMDSFEFSKIAAGVLLALLVIFGSRTYINSQHEHYDAKEGYTLPVEVAGDGAPGGGEAAPAFDPANIVAMLPAADPAAGEKSFGLCKSCHTNDAGGANKTGPNLWNVVNRPLGGQADFGGYSKIIKEKGGEWTYENLAAFLHKPRDYLPGTKMSFAGIKKDGDLANMIAYLRTLADSPAALPEVSKEAAAPASEGEASANDPASAEPKDKPAEESPAAP